MNDDEGEVHDAIIRDMIRQHSKPNDKKVILPRRGQPEDIQSHHIEIRYVNNNAVECVGCQIHGDPGVYDVMLSRLDLAVHLGKHAAHISKTHVKSPAATKEVSHD